MSMTYEVLPFIRLIAEAFIGQELLAYASPTSKAELHYWKRKEKSSSAEIDYLIQREENIIPIEVKSGHGSTLQSLRMYLELHPKAKMGIRFSANDYSINKDLDSRPLYAAVSLAHPSQYEALNSMVTN